MLLGKNGQVGWELQRALAPLCTVVALGREDLDLADTDRIRVVVRDHKPGLIVNAAAYTDVDRAESEPDLAKQVNGVAPGILAEEAARLGAGLIHFSTDYVFDGAKDEPYTEEDAPNPLNVYGETKFAGERAIEGVGGQYLILRTSWVYSLRRKSFVTRVLKWAHSESVIRVVDDQVSSPTWCRALAEMVSQFLPEAKEDFRAFFREKSGLYHLAASGRASRHQWAQAILSADPQRDEQTLTTLQPVKTKEFPSRAKRPSFSVLDSGKFLIRFSLRSRSWRSQLSIAMSEGSGDSPTEEWAV